MGCCYQNFPGYLLESGGRWVLHRHMLVCISVGLRGEGDTWLGAVRSLGVGLFQESKFKWRFTTTLEGGFAFTRVHPCSLAIFSQNIPKKYNVVLSSYCNMRQAMVYIPHHVQQFYKTKLPCSLHLHTYNYLANHEIRINQRWGQTVPLHVSSTGD